MMRRCTRWALPNFVAERIGTHQTNPSVGMRFARENLDPIRAGSHHSRVQGQGDVEEGLEALNVVAQVAAAGDRYSGGPSLETKGASPPRKIPRAT